MLGSSMLFPKFLKCASSNYSHRNDPSTLPNWDQQSNWRYMRKLGLYSPQLLHKRWRARMDSYSLILFCILLILFELCAFLHLILTIFWYFFNKSRSVGNDEGTHTETEPPSSRIDHKSRTHTISTGDQLGSSLSQSAIWRSFSSQASIVASSQISGDIMQFIKGLPSQFRDTC